MFPLRNRIAIENLHSARREHWPLLFTLLLAAWWSAPMAAHAQPWKTIANKDGIRIESRRIPDERFEQLRVATTLEVAPAVIADYLVGKYLDVKNRNITRKFVERDRNLTIWSDILRTPMISERCYSMRFERHARDDGEIRVKFASLDYIGRTAAPNCIALRSRGEWILKPTGSGTRLSYISLTDIGGKVPVAFARRSLTAAALLNVRKVVAGSSGLPLPKGIGD